MDSRWSFSARIHTPRFLLGVEKQKLAVVIIRNAIDRTLAGERPTNIIALAQQPLCQDRLADLPLLLPEVRQSILVAWRAALCGSSSACTGYYREAVLRPHASP